MYSSGTDTIFHRLSGMHIFFMPRSPRAIIWILVAWPLPALIASALSWNTVWGSGSVLIDYLIPIPVAGGALHVPSFLLCGFVVFNTPSSNSKSLSRLRALLIGIALAGLLLLLNLDDMFMAMQTNSSLNSDILQENPLGLFLLSDSLVALGLTLGIVNGPWLRLEVTTLLLMLLPSAIPISMTYKYSSADNPFIEGSSRQGSTRNDGVHMVYTSLDVHDPNFHVSAEDWANSIHPRFMIDEDDVAILFTQNLDAARSFDTTQAVTTLCLYEDDTPSLWLQGAESVNCFERHLSFSEKFTSAYNARPSDEPQDLKDYMSRKDICIGVKAIPPSGETSGLELSGMRICSRLAETREKLLLKYPEAVTQLE